MINGDAAMTCSEPVTWVPNPRAANIVCSPAALKYFPQEVSRESFHFHRQIEGFNCTPLHSLHQLACMLGIADIWVKDESGRLNLGSFKGTGGSYAIFRTIHKKLGSPEHFTYADLFTQETKQKLGKFVFAAATDGNHGLGVAWSARQLGCDCFIYVHKDTAEARKAAIRKNGAEVVVVNGNYDDAVRQANADAQQHGWQVISDTAWEGYEDIPTWVMQGYTTVYHEVQQQLAAIGEVRPTHIFMQAGVGSLAASAFGYYAALFGPDRPKMVVVEPDQAACLFRSVEIGDGNPHSVKGNLSTMMAGLACGDPNPLAWKILYDCADGFIKCPDYVAAKGMRVAGAPLPGDPGMIAGESGAVTLGALMFLMEKKEYQFIRDALGLDHTSKVLLVNSEGNTDPDNYLRVVWDGGEQTPQAYCSYSLKSGDALQ